ncbi:hypothetical protein [Streptomyces sp. NPDC018347]|uniref:hypothetical protein n=1 Tax=Streptomyces sp. NPDC018347 TaxID=3157193 RepID=UPI0033CE2000
MIRAPRDVGLQDLIEVLEADVVVWGWVRMPMRPEGPAERAAETVRMARAALPKGSLTLARIDAHRTDAPRAHARTSRFAALRPADLTVDGAKRQGPQ